MTNINSISNIMKSAEYEKTRNGTLNQAGNDFASYLEESQDLDEIFERASIKYNVPVNLLKAIGKAESNFDPNAVSKSGAQGVMQLMPGTAAGLGVTDSFDPEQNIMGGSKYIADLLKRYDGDTKLALAAYNAGMGNVKKYGGIPPFKETQNYVVKVMQYMEQDFTAGSVKDRDSKQSAPAAAASVRASGSSMIGTVPNWQPNLQPDWHTPPAFPTGKLSADNISDLLDALFSYQDYLKFINIFMDMKEDNHQMNQQYRF